tara:strand:+ start:487 stop:675 length:189 start_codon:yes stop_codon:yes gene_type:complete
MAPVNFFFLAVLLTIADSSAKAILRATFWPYDITVIAGQTVTFQVTMGRPLTPINLLADLVH